MSQKLAFVLSLALSAAAHELHDAHGLKRTPSPTILARGPPYPTGPGYDVVPLASIVPLSPGQPVLVFSAPALLAHTLTRIRRVLLKYDTCPNDLPARLPAPYLQSSSHPNL